MTLMPSVSFIDGEPPDDASANRTNPRAWSGYVVGRLQNEPGRWAIIGVESHWANPSADKLRRWGKAHEVVVEAVSRKGELFARYVDRPENTEDTDVD